jgi:hypothetical protein
MKTGKNTPWSFETTARHFLCQNDGGDGQGDDENVFQIFHNQ